MTDAIRQNIPLYTIRAYTQRIRSHLGAFQRRGDTPARVASAAGPSLPDEWAGATEKQLIYFALAYTRDALDKSARAARKRRDSNLVPFESEHCGATNGDSANATPIKSHTRRGDGAYRRDHPFTAPKPGAVNSSI